MAVLGRLAWSYVQGSQVTKVELASLGFANVIGSQLVRMLAVAESRAYYQTMLAFSEPSRGISQGTNS